MCHQAPATQAASADGHRSVSDLWAMASAIRHAHLDLIYFPTDYSYVPFFTDVPRLVTIHDVIAEQFPWLVFPTLRSKVSLPCQDHGWASGRPDC